MENINRYNDFNVEELCTIHNKSRNYTIYDIYDWYVCESTGEMIIMSEFIRLYNTYNNSVKDISWNNYKKTPYKYISFKWVDFKYSNKIDIYEFEQLCFKRAAKDYLLEKINTDNLIKLMYHE